MSKYDLGPKTGLSSAVRVTIYVWVSTLLAIVLLQSAMLIDHWLYLQILWRHDSKLTHSHGLCGFQHPEQHTRRSGPFQHREYQLDVRNSTRREIMNLTNFASVGIVIISVISLFVSSIIHPCSYDS
jgi:hypothetical protein